MAVVIEKLVNGKLVPVNLKEALKPTKVINDKERLSRYRGERVEIDNEKKGG